MDLGERAARAQATLDAWKGKPFRMGVRDCARMTASHLRRMGHQVKLPASGSYASERSGKKALAARGFTDLIEAMDSFGFERIAPAFRVAGDVVAIPTESALGCLTIALGSERVAGYQEDAAGAQVLQPLEYVAAWRIPIRSGSEI
jgi:hypothetical protein